VSDPLVVTQLREFKEGVLAREAQQQRLMARRWLQVEAKLESQITALSEQITRLSLEGKDVASRVHTLDRYHKLLAQAQEEFQEYAQWADGVITSGQTEMALGGVQHSLTLLDTIAVGMDFNRLNPSAVTNMIGMTADGQPLGELLKLRMVRDSTGLPLPGVHERLSQTLVNATAQGWNPRKTADMIRDDLSGGLDKALQISRTEQIRSYRMAQAQAYEASGLNLKVKRLVAHNDRTCLACLSREGEVTPANVPIADHPLGRCTGVPFLADGPEPQFLSGEKWLESQPEATQRSIMGGKRFDAWKNGDVKFGDFASVTHDPVWGGGLKVTPLRELGVGKNALVEFANNREAAAWAQSQYGKITNAGDLDTLRRYQGAGYQGMNPYLRGTKKFTPERAAGYRSEAKRIDAVLGEHALPNDVVVLRGTGLSAFKVKSASDLEGIVGQVFVDKGYMSTALTTKIPTAFKSKQVLMRVRVPKGTPSYYMPNVATEARMRAEQELLLGRGQKFIIDGVKFNGRSGKWEIDATILAG
jgi:hypothetical protein